MGPSFYSILINGLLRTFKIGIGIDFFSINPVHIDDFAIALFDFKVLKIMLFQHIDDTLPCIQSFQTFNYIYLPIFDDQFNGEESFVPYHIQHLDFGAGQSQGF